MIPGVPERQGGVSQPPAIRPRRPRPVTLLPGDGIGPEVISCACRVVEATGVAIEWRAQTVGGRSVEAGLDSVPGEVLADLRRTGVGLKGPVSSQVPGLGERSAGTEASFRSPNLEIRDRLALRAQVRPCRAYTGVSCLAPGADVVVVRDTTEDLYAGIEFAAGSQQAEQVLDIARIAGHGFSPGAAVSLKPLSEAGCRRLVGFAVDFARRTGRRRVTVVHKASVMRATDGMLLEVAREIAAAETEVLLDDRLVDAACAELVRRPAAFEVLVTLALYGDILSDLAAALTGGVGFAPGANYGPACTVFEPAHGTAPRHAGRDRANPVGAIMSGAMLLHHIGERDAAARVEAAVGAALASGPGVTYDVATERHAATVGTNAFTDLVIERL